LKGKYEFLKNYFLIDSSGKKSINQKRAGIAGAGLLLVFAVLAALVSPKKDETFFRQSSEPQEKNVAPVLDVFKQDKVIKNLFSNGSQQLAQQKKSEAAKKHSAISIKYFASQVIGVNSKGPRSIKTGAKLLGFLLTSIDTREPSIVSVILPQGGVSNSGFEIQKNSVLIGGFSYRGNGNKVSMSFSRLDTPDGDSIKIAAMALDAADYTAGIRGDVHSDDGLKVASSLGLTMAASMTDVLTQREAIGNSMGPAQAKPTMQNALLQGISQTSKDQAGRVSEEINSTKDYIFIPKGKEVIVQLSEDLK